MLFIIFDKGSQESLGFPGGLRVLRGPGRPQETLEAPGIRTAPKHEVFFAIFDKILDKKL